jgi:hypothetical protein
VSSAFCAPVFQFYEIAQAQIKAGIRPALLHDAQFRDPSILIGLARRYDALPDPEKTVLVTGSKGKGSTARLISWQLQALMPNAKIGLVVSPEELTHLDRIRLNGLPIEPQQFEILLNSIQVDLLATQYGKHANYYHSPSGIFLLVALLWFKQRRVDFVVIEGGRGALYDEIAEIPAKLGCVTSILLEHAQQIGPTIEAIATDKLSLSRHCESLIVGPSVLPWVTKLGITARIPASDPMRATPADLPRWLVEAHRMSIAVADALGFSDAQINGSAVRVQSPSFQRLRVSANTELILDGAVHVDCLEPSLLRSVLGTTHFDSTKKSKAAVIVALTPDKSPQEMVRSLNDLKLGADLFELPCFKIGEPAQSCTALKQLPMLNLGLGIDSDLAASLSSVFQTYERVYMIGVQLALVAMRNYLGLGLCTHDPAQESV